MKEVFYKLFGFHRFVLESLMKVGKGLQMSADILENHQKRINELEKTVEELLRTKF